MRRRSRRAARARRARAPLGWKRRGTATTAAHARVPAEDWPSPVERGALSGLFDRRGRDGEQRREAVVVTFNAARNASSLIAPGSIPAASSGFHSARDGIGLARETRRA